MLNESIIKALEERGFKRWTKGDMDRLYINSTCLGLDVEYYKTSGNISGATLNGEHISNRQAYAYKSAKNYIDITTGEIVSSVDEFIEAMKQIFDEVTGQDIKPESMWDTTQVANQLEDMGWLPSEIVLYLAYSASNPDPLNPDSLADWKKCREIDSTDNNDSIYAEMTDEQLFDEKNMMWSRTGYGGIFDDIKRAELTRNDSAREQLDAELSDISTRWNSLMAEMGRRGLLRQRDGDFIDKRNADIQRYSEKGDAGLVFRARMRIAEARAALN